MKEYDTKYYKNKHKDNCHELQEKHAQFINEII